MTKEDIIRMARESGECQLSDRQFALHGLEQITRFAALVAAASAAAENEACAKVCDEQGNMFWNSTEDAAEWTPSDCAEAIRARGNTCQK